MIKKDGYGWCLNFKHMWTSLTHKCEFCFNCHYEGKERVK